MRSTRSSKSSVRRHSLTLLLWCGVSGCAHGNSQPPTVLLVPGGVLGVPEAEGDRLTGALHSELAQNDRVVPIESVRADAALAATSTPPEPCAESDTCLAIVGSALAADLVLSVTMAGLGDVRLVRARLVDVRQRVAVQDLQDTIPTERKSLHDYAALLAQRLFPGASPEPWYEQWWLWTAVAGVVAVGAGITWWALERPADDPTMVLGQL